jgi:hypothetical protein
VVDCWVRQGGVGVGESDADIFGLQNLEGGRQISAKAALPEPKLLLPRRVPVLLDVRSEEPVRLASLRNRAGNYFVAEGITEVMTGQIRRRCSACCLVHCSSTAERLMLTRRLSPILSQLFSALKDAVSSAQCDSESAIFLRVTRLMPYSENFHGHRSDRPGPGIAVLSVRQRRVLVAGKNPVG